MQSLFAFACALVFLFSSLWYVSRCLLEVEPVNKRNNFSDFLQTRVPNFTSAFCIVFPAMYPKARYFLF